MSALTDKQIPRLTDAVSDEEAQTEGSPRGLDLDEQEMDALIAELQTAIAARTFRLTDELMRKAFAEMEAGVFRQISSNLREELPEMIDTILRAQLEKRQED